MVKGDSICVKVYLKPELFAEVAQAAETSGKRRKGLLLYTQKPHGFANEKLANTDGVSRYLKYCHTYYQETESHRHEQAAEALRAKQEAEARLKKLGMG